MDSLSSNHFIVCRKAMDSHLKHACQNRAAFQTFGMSWSPNRQVMFCDADVFSHRGSTSTDPSHDLAHLLVAASSTLPWKPGRGNKAKLAEFNAFLVENILDAIYNCVLHKTDRVDRILPFAAARARWFVEEHYAPFPMSTKGAFDEFRARIDGASMVRLSPLFLNQKRCERTYPHFRSRTYQICFRLQESLPIDKTSLAFQEALSLILSQIGSYNYDLPLARPTRIAIRPKGNCRICDIASLVGRLFKLTSN